MNITEETVIEGWKQGLHKMFRIRIMEALTEADNGVYVKELVWTNRKEKVSERVLKYCRRLLKIEQSSLLGDALTYQSKEREGSWICGIKRELEKLGMGCMWRRGRENVRNSWKMVNQWCVDTQRQGMDTIMREKK
jgi:hypothetical protein